MRTAAMNMNAATARTAHQGVRQIVSFNWPKYAWTAAMICVSLAAWPFTGALFHTAMLALVVPALYWMIASIAVSYYVYDRYPLYDLLWLRSSLAAEPQNWVNIHAGLDETSALIEAQFARARGEVVDIFDARTMTEPSIGRARQQSGNAIRAIRARYDSLPFEDGRFDAAFLIFAAHEVRRHAERVQLFREVARVLNADGEMVLMEHMRDGWNFAAFGPGALHFFSRRAWMRAAREAGLELRSESARTPFVHVLVLRRAR